MFDTPAELLEKIRLGEDSLIEFTAITCSEKGICEPHPDHLAQALAAFANSLKGGVLVLGVNDKTRELEGLRHNRAKGLGPVRSVGEAVLQ